MEINFSSKVYSKSLLKVWSLKGSVVYFLILDYQFCASVWFAIALLTSGFGQVWAKHVCPDVTPQLWQRLEDKRSIQGDNCNKDVASRLHNATAVA